MQMRSRQCIILKRVYSDIVRLTTTPQQVSALADFVMKVADEFAEENDVKELLEQLAGLGRAIRFRSFQGAGRSSRTGLCSIISWRI